MIYLEERLVNKAVVQMAQRLPGAWLATDTCATKMTSQKLADNARKRFGIRSWFKWACDDPKSLERWHDSIELVSAKTLPEASPEMHGQLPGSWRTMMRWLPWLVRRMTGGYHIAHYHFATAPVASS